MKQLVHNLISSRPTLKSFKDAAADDRSCVLQDAVRKASITGSSNDDFAQELVSLLHRSDKLPSRKDLSSVLPSAESVFDRLLLNSKGVENDHPNGISGLASAFLNIANLSLRLPQSSTQWKEPSFNLYPLYGEKTSDSDPGCDKVRLKDGRGLLSPDCFYDDRLSLFPRATTALLILFNRNHNYIATRLLLQNEESIKDFKDDAQMIAQDNDIFEKARQINCAYFRNIMLEDVLKLLLGLPSVGSSPEVNFLSKLNDCPDIGQGIEKNDIGTSVLYEFSDIMSRREDVVRSVVGDERSSKIPANDLDNAPAVDAQGRDYAWLTRRSDGYFDDIDLARILHETTECPARSTGEGLPSHQRTQQIETIQWARDIGTCSFVDYRRYLRLKVPRDFHELTTNTAVANAAKILYGSIENLELYVGLQLEDTINGDNDSGFRFGYTKTFGLLVDIVSRIRNDPALTADFSSANVTDWGIKDCLPRPNNGSFGASLPKLLQRTLPRQYIFNNIYGLFPFSTPTHTRKLLQTQTNAELSKLYNMGKPKLGEIQHLVTTEEIRQVFNKPEEYPNPYSDNLLALTNGYGYFLGFDNEEQHDQDMMMSLHALIPDSSALAEYTQAFSRVTNEVIKANTDADGELDVAKVIDIVCIRWVCETLLEYPLADDFVDNFDYYIYYPLQASIQTVKTVLRCTKLCLEGSIFIVDFLKDLTATTESNKESDPDAAQNESTVPTESKKAPTESNTPELEDTAPTEAEKQPDSPPSWLESASTVLHRLDNTWISIEETPFVRWSTSLFQERKPQRDETQLIEDLSDKFSSIYTFVFQNFNQEDAWMLRERAFAASGDLSKHISQRIPRPVSITNQSYFSSLQDASKELKATLRNIMTEFVIGIALREQSAQTFLSGIVNINKNIPPFPFQRHPGDNRIVANVLGLAVIASVKYAKVCTQAVDFYLQEEYEEERKKIVELSNMDDPESKKLLVGYIREAYRLDHPLGLWRRTTRVNAQGETVKGDDVVYADFRQALRYPERVDPTASRPHGRAMQGFGLHRCPGFNFVDETMPEIFKAIFKLKGLRRSTEGRRGTLRRINPHPQLHDVSGSLFVNPKPIKATNLTTVDTKHETPLDSELVTPNEAVDFTLDPYPRSLILQHYSFKDDDWKNPSLAQKREEWRKTNEQQKKIFAILKDAIIAACVLVFLSTLIFGFDATLHNLTVFFVPSTFRETKTLPSPSIISSSASVATFSAAPSSTPVECSSPTSEINPWEIITMRAGENGKLHPIEYTLDLPTAHRLQFMDVEEKDMRMKLFLDNSDLLLPTDVQLDKSISCGFDLSVCLRLNFSSGDSVIPKGNHTVRIEWAEGTETPGPDGKIDWGATQGRRIAWTRTQCGA